MGAGAGTVKIKTGAALDDAARLRSMLDDMRDDLEKLHSVINQTIPDYVKTEWAEALQGDWNTYYGRDIPSTLEEMAFSADNIVTVAEEAKKESKKNIAKRP